MGPLVVLLSMCGQSCVSTPAPPSTTHVAAPVVTAPPAPTTTVTTATTALPPTLEDAVDDAIARFRARDDGRQGVFAYAWMAGAVAARRGWHDPAVATYLDQVYAQQNPDGGYGLGYAWDAFGDGSVNPADTTYAITLSDHVGPILLDGWRAGVVPAERVQQIVDLLGSFPLVDGDGTCIAYSSSPADVAAPCVPNINASAAAFLVRAADAGFDADLSRVPAIVDHDLGVLRADDWWPYIVGRTVAQDWQHNATMVDAYMTLDPAVGRRTLAAMRRTSSTVPWDQMAMLRLARWDCTFASPPPVLAALRVHTSPRDIAIIAYEGAIAAAAC